MQLAPEMSLSQFGKRGHNRYLPLGFCSGPAGPVLTDFLLKCHEHAMRAKISICILPTVPKSSKCMSSGPGFCSRFISYYFWTAQTGLYCLYIGTCTNVCNEKNQLHAELWQTLAMLMRRKSAMIKKETRVNFSMPKEPYIPATMGSAPVTTRPILCEFL